MRTSHTDESDRNRAGWALAAWGVLFALPSFVWAAGGTLGASSTVAPSLVRLAQERVPWFVAVLWLTGVLKLLASAVGLTLCRVRPPLVGRAAAFCAGGAAVLLSWHGLLFVIRGLLAETGVAGVRPELATLVRWYLYLWGPYFFLGGLAAFLALRWYLRRTPDTLRAHRWAVLGAAGGALVSLLSTLSGVG